MLPTVLQLLPKLEVGGVERGTVEVAAELVRRKHRSIVISDRGKLVPQLLAEGSEFIQLPVGKKSVFSAGYIPRLRKLFMEKDIDIIHARSRFPAWLAYLAWRKMPADTRPVFVTTVHGPYTVNRYSKIMTAGEKVIAVSNYIKNYIVENYPDVNENKIETIPRGINKEEYRFNHKPPAAWLTDWAKRHPQLTGKFIITLPARITRWKGHNDFIKIIKKTLQADLDVHGLVVGGADPGKRRYMRELKTIIRQNGLENRFTFLGHRDDMKDIMSVSNIVLSLAKTPEAFGRTALEALSLGIPVIAYDHGGAAEVLAEIFPAGRARPFDVDHVCELVRNFYNNTPPVKDTGHFTLDDMLDQTLSVYNSFF